MIENHSHSWWSWDWQKVSYKNLVDVPAIIPEVWVRIKHWYLSSALTWAQTLTIWFQIRHILIFAASKFDAWAYWIYTSNSSWWYSVADGTNYCESSRTTTNEAWWNPSAEVRTSYCFYLSMNDSSNSTYWIYWTITSTTSTAATLTVTNDWNPDINCHIYWIAFW